MNLKPSFDILTFFHFTLENSTDSITRLLFFLLLKVPVTNLQRTQIEFIIICQSDGKLGSWIWDLLSLKLNFFTIFSQLIFSSLIKIARKSLYDRKALLSINYSIKTENDSGQRYLNPSSYGHLPEY